MKKIIIVIISAIIVGFALGIFSLDKFNLVKATLATIDTKEAYAIQIGVYSKKENADVSASKNNGLVIEDNDIYRVYLSILKDPETINIIKTYLQDQGIDCYLKPVSISNPFSESLAYYETILNETNKDNYKTILESILKEYEKEI